MDELISLACMQTLHTDFHPYGFAINRNLHFFEIGFPASSRLSMRMRNIVAIHGTLATNITSTSHIFLHFSMWGIL